MLGWAGAVLQHIREVFVYERRLDDRDEREILLECHAVMSAAFPAVVHPAHETPVAHEGVLHGSLVRPSAFEAFDGGGLKVSLEYLVHCGAHVDISVGEGRTVMKNKLLMSLIFLQHEGVEIYFVPIFEHFRLALGKIGAHGEGCCG